jgi:hypothetical protein
MTIRKLSTVAALALAVTGVGATNPALANPDITCGQPFTLIGTTFGVPGDFICSVKFVCAEGGDQKILSETFLPFGICSDEVQCCYSFKDAVIG